MDIYADILLLENIVMNYLILWLTSITLKVHAGRIKMLAASVVGALYALLIFFPGYNFLYTTVMKVLLSLLIIVIAFTPIRFREFLKQLSVFYLISFILGGAVFGLFYFTNTGTVTEGGVFLIKGIPLSVLAGAGLVTIIIIRLCLVPLYGYLEKRSLYRSFAINVGDKWVEAVGLLDTGNELFDPITNYPVIVVQYSAVKELLHEGIREIFEQNLEDDLENIYEGFKQANWVSRLRLIPFSSLGKEKGMLLGFKADGVIIGSRCLDKVIIAIYSKPLSENGEYAALLNPELIK
ncbi:MAG: sigma-E processing peptidase SpoIIGA [Clostridiales bacterium]|jgi:stage II sporulation protein GA (sporulation sigma-E factor processing peptidase)|nr:sigma-E processing peptidase SpoIIGA [Clostridiales bacterium]